MEKGAMAVGRFLGNLVAGLFIIGITAGALAFAFFTIKLLIAALAYNPLAG